MFAPTQTRLSTSEIYFLWTAFENDAMATCFLRYFLHHAKDAKIKNEIEHALNISKNHIDWINHLFREEKIGIEEKFGHEDVNMKSGPLFSEIFPLLFLKTLGKSGLENYGLSFSESDRKDIRVFFTNCIRDSIKIIDRVKNLLEKKGASIQPPVVPISETPDKVRDNRFLSGWFGKRRPLLMAEVTHLSANLEMNAFSNILAIAFEQTAESKEVKSYFERAKQIGKKHVQVFGQLLSDEDLPAPNHWNTHVSGLREPVFSERLIMNFSNALNMIKVANYGLSIAASPRHDLSLHYHRLLAEIEKLAEDGLQLTIKNKWLAYPPAVIERK